MPSKKKSGTAIANVKRQYNRQHHDEPQPKKRKRHAAFVSLNDLYHGDITLSEKSNIGEMKNMCQHCSAFMFQHENHIGSLGTTAQFSTCCSQGKITLPELKDPPKTLQTLLTDNTAQAQLFRQNIRAFNSSLAIASLGVKEDLLPKKGPYIFRINGAVVHRIGPMFPDEGKNPKFAQIYIYDSNHELSNRVLWNKDLSEPIILDLQKMLHDNNPFVNTFKFAASAMKNNDEVKLILTADTTKDSRRYNLPTSSEVSVLIPGSDTQEPSNRDIVLFSTSKNNPNDHKIVHINETHPKYDSLHYVLLFPYGEDGWHLNILHSTTSKKVSVMEFYSYRLMHRPNFNILLRSGRLFHQYVVDQYSKMEQERLNYCLYHQHELRAELYQGLSDAISSGDVSGSSVGQKIILPSSYIGSPRYMHQLYQDAMAIVRKFGKPDLFITFTCNPNWINVKEALIANQTPADRPDLTARVFHLKLKELLSDIVDRQIFGKTLAYVYVVEFQKRGLPHAHFLIILDNDSKPRNPDQFDEFVSSEIPDPLLLPELHQLVTMHMIHGPCGKANPKSPCMADEKCTKQFPKIFMDKAVQSQDGYPLYKRRDNGITVEKHGLKIDNHWVVPYNPFLLYKYGAHINVEICSSVTAVKYLYKYVYKGPDRVMVGSSTDNEINEIQQYIDARYVSASEACWRIFHYELQNRSPGIQKLAVHLPHMESVVYKVGNAVHTIESMKNTTLTAWFKKNREDPEARSVLYHHFPEHYTWDQTTGSWKSRKKGNMIGRVYRANPTEGERFYLRLLLHHIPGCTSFESLRTLDNGFVCESFKETASRRGLLQDDLEWYECLEEASSHASPSQLRSLFTIILVFSEPSNHVALWDKFKEYMSQDLKYQMNRESIPHSEHEILNKLIFLIQNQLCMYGKSLIDFPGMPQPIVADKDILDTFSQLDQMERANTNVEMLNADQKHVYNSILNTIKKHSKNTLFFVDGPGGSGKTFLYNTILARLRSQGIVALAVASSGIASELLSGGRTAHSTFKIPIPITEASTCNIHKQSALAEKIKSASIIIWDEAPMVHKHVIECVHRTFCDILDSEDPFGGKLILFGGDFRQILPVIRHGSQAEIIDSNLKRSFLWQYVQTFHLTINMRVHTNKSLVDTEFEQFLMNIGNGRNNKTIVWHTVSSHYSVQHLC